MAAGAAFFILLALFPALAALVSFYGLFTDPVSINAHVAAAAAVLPADGYRLLDQQLTRIAAAGRPRLGLTLAGSLGLSLWSANLGMKALIDALNVAFGVPERRGILRLNAVSLVLTVGGIAFLLAAMAAVVGVPVLLAMAGLPPLHGDLIAVLRWPTLLALATVALAVIYRFGPCHHRRRGLLSWGSVLATLGWIAVSLLFSLYVERFTDYNHTYGSLGAVVGFMTWLWLSITVVLVGAEIDAAVEHTRGDQSARSDAPQ